MEEYNTAKKEYQMLIDYQSQCFSFINSVKAIAQHGFTIDALSLTTQIQFYLSKQYNPIKDYFDYLQSTGGFKEKNETFEDCARREALEEAKLELKELFFVCFQEGFRQFPDGKECLYKTAIYFTILDDDMIPKQVEPNNNGEWYPYELKELSKLKLTPFIESNLKQITEMIQNKFKRRPTKKQKYNDDTKNTAVEENSSSI
ncbi:6788_t:CDS:2, partial [Gigaspora rosea]